MDPYMVLTVMGIPSNMALNLFFFFQVTFLRIRPHDKSPIGGGNWGTLRIPFGKIGEH